MTPHKCPVCEGAGRLPRPAEGSIVIGVECHACSGSGIVWDYSWTHPGWGGNTPTTCDVTTFTTDAVNVCGAN